MQKDYGQHEFRLRISNLKQSLLVRHKKFTEALIKAKSSGVNLSKGLQAISHSGRQILGLVNDLLDLAKQQVGTF